ncbi:MAG: hypothetical protein ACFFE3_10470 [Candidatus Thorarchaeota archaeon]
MPNSTNEKSCGIPVIVYLKTGDVKRGVLHYRREGPFIDMGSGSRIDKTANAQFRFSDEIQILSKSMNEELIELNPEVVVESNYSPNKIFRVKMYPPDSGDWLSHIVDSGLESIVTIQRFTKNAKKILTIVDKHSYELYLAKIIHSYESNILYMTRDWIVHNEVTYSDVLDADIFNVLEDNNQTWSALSKLVEGVEIQSFTKMGNLEDTLDQIVPESFSPNERRQVMAFLGWLENAAIPKEDPIDFLVKYRSVDVFRTLAFGHLECMLNGIDPPNYVRIMRLAERGLLELSKRPQSEAAEQNLWNLVRLKLNEVFPDSTKNVLDYIQPLQKANRIVTELPVSRSEARKSKRLWSHRFSLTRHMPFMRGHIRKESLGLIPTIYIGAAHTWPHKHLEWSARLGYQLEKPQYIQVMVMPSSALERVSRIIPTVRRIDWEMSTVNLSSYNEKRRKWGLKLSLILGALDRTRSIKQLENEFGGQNGKNHFTLTTKQAKILDLISWGLYLSSVESERYARYYGITNQELKLELETMHRQGLFVLQYYLIPERLRSICILAHGPKKNILSLSRAFLRYTPSAQVRITNEGSSTAIVSRVPEDDHYKLVTDLTHAAKDSEISLKVLPISAYAGYRNNLYSRLLMEDKSWDDDVSGLLNQARLQS